VGQYHRHPAAEEVTCPRPQTSQARSEVVFPPAPWGFRLPIPQLLKSIASIPNACAPTLAIISRKVHVFYNLRQELRRFKKRMPLHSLKPSEHEEAILYPIKTSTTQDFPPAPTLREYLRHQNKPTDIPPPPPLLPGRGLNMAVGVRGK
jgi:hypothetical protein